MTYSLISPIFCSLQNEFHFMEYCLPCKNVLFSQNGYTPLHIASKKNQMDIATTLLEFGARPDAESKVRYFLQE